MKFIREYLSSIINQKIGVGRIVYCLFVTVFFFWAICCYPIETNFDAFCIFVSILMYSLIVVMFKRAIHRNKEVIKQKISEFWTAVDIKTLAMTCLVLTATFLIAIIMPMANISCLAFVIILGSCSSAMVVLSMRIFKDNKEISILEKEIRIGKENIKRYESEIAVHEQNIRMYNEQIRQLNQFKQQDER